MGKADNQQVRAAWLCEKGSLKWHEGADGPQAEQEPLAMFCDGE